LIRAFLISFYAAVHVAQLCTISALHHFSTSQRIRINLLKRLCHLRCSNFRFCF